MIHARLRLPGLLLFLLLAGLSWLWLGHWLAGVIAGLIFFGSFRIVVVHMLLDGLHQQGLRRVQRGQVSEAQLSFRKAERFWSGLQWLDRNRAWLLASGSRWSYRARARYNRIGCLIHQGRHDEAEPLLDELLEWCPRMIAARRLRERLGGADLGSDWAELAKM